jgi:hypothetical protein
MCLTKPSIKLKPVFSYPFSALKITRPYGIAIAVRIKTIFFAKQLHSSLIYTSSPFKHQGLLKHTGCNPGAMSKDPFRASREKRGTGLAGGSC